MPYIYCLEIKPDTKADVNEDFRNKNLLGELFMGNEKLYLSPQINEKLWICHPIREKETNETDTKWDNAIKESLLFMEKEYQMERTKESPKWKYFETFFRCPKMVDYIQKNIDY